MTAYVPYQEISAKLHLKKGESLLVASDITRLAFSTIRKEGGLNADLLINSLQKQLGNKGTLLFPAYTFRLKDKDGFDLKKSIPITGALSEAAFQRDDFCRTKHPLHSFMVWGNLAPKFCSLQNQGSFDDNSPFALLYELKARMLLIGTTVGEAFTFTHFVEQYQKVAYRKKKTLRILYKDEEGEESEKIYSIYAKKRGWNMVMDKLEQLLLLAGAMETSTINGVDFTLIDLNKAFDVVKDDITHNQAKSIARFEYQLYLKETVKDILKSLRVYRTTADKISDGTGI